MPVAAAALTAVQGAPALFAAPKKRCEARPVDMERPLLAASKGAWGRLRYSRGEHCDVHVALEIRSPVDGEYAVAVDGQSCEHVMIDGGVGQLAIEGELVPGEFSALLDTIGRRVELTDGTEPILQRLVTE